MPVQNCVNGLQVQLLVLKIAKLLLLAQTSHQVIALPTTM